MGLRSRSAPRSSQVAASPCCKQALPDIISAILVQALGPLPGGDVSVLQLVASQDTAASHHKGHVRLTRQSLQQLPQGGIFPGCSHSLMFRLPDSLDLQVAPDASFEGRPGRLHHASLGWFTCPEMWYRYVRERAIHTAGLSPAGLQPCRLLPLRVLPGPEPFEQAVEAFGRRLAAEGRSPSTISAYLRDLRRLTAVLLERHPGLTPGRVTSALLDEALTSPAVVTSATGTARAPGVAATASRWLSGPSSPGRKRPDRWRRNPARSVTLRRLPPTTPSFLTEAEKRRLLKEFPGAILEARPPGPAHHRAVPGHRHPAVACGAA